MIQEKAYADDVGYKSMLINALVTMTAANSSTLGSPMAPREGCGDTVHTCGDAVDTCGDVV